MWDGGRGASGHLCLAGSGSHHAVLGRWQTRRVTRQIVETRGNLQKRVVKVVGAFDNIHGQSKGGIAPKGWRCDHLPYLVELDN